MAPTAKQFTNKKPSLASPLLIFSVSCLPLLLFGKGFLIYSHTRFYKIRTNVYVNNFPVIILGGEVHISSWCLCGVLLRKANRIELNEDSLSLTR